MSAEVRRAGDSAGSDPSIPRNERWIAGILLGLALALRCFYIFHYRYDSDEPQHLHTTWGWTQGLLQYRDFFDNHTPLFHILFSPLVAALGERTNILDFMRFAMVPLWFASLWCVWKIGAAVFSRRVGLWATLLISLLSWWFFPALEYRTDNLWTPLWLGALATLVCGNFTRWRAFAGGLLLGFCFTVSMKTSLLCAVLALTAFLAPLVVARRVAWAALVRTCAAIWPVFVGMVIAPAILVSCFAAVGAWEPFWYGTIRHNLLAGVDATNHPLYLRFVFPVALPFLLVIAAWIGRRASDPASGMRRAGLFLVTGFYYTGLYTFWTLLTRQDYLPFYPLVAVLLAAALLTFARRFTAPRQAWVLVIASLVELAMVLGGRPPFKVRRVAPTDGPSRLELQWINETLREREILAEVLRLTRPGEYVMDFKGESVFRRRAFFYVMEPLTFVHVRRKDIRDNVAERLLETKTEVVLNQDRWYPKAAAAFMGQNYLAVGRMRVAGKVIADRAATSEAIHFDVAVPAAYCVWADGQPINGTIDGQPVGEARELAAGPHDFTPTEPHGRVAIFWSRAAREGFQPVLDRAGWQDFR
jgi:hypothetical protein